MLQDELFAESATTLGMMKVTGIADEKKHAEDKLFAEQHCIINCDSLNLLCMIYSQFRRTNLTSNDVLQPLIQTCRNELCPAHVSLF